MTGTTLSDLEQSALQLVVTRRGALPDAELVDQVVHEVVDPLSVDDLLSMVVDDPTSLLLRQPDYVGTVESPAELVKQNCREYLGKLLELKMTTVDAETAGV